MGPEYTESNERGRAQEHANVERPDADDLADLARRQRISPSVVQEATLAGLGVHLDGTAGGAQRRAVEDAPTHDPHLSRRAAAPERTPATPGIGRRETPAMHDQDLQSLADTRNLQRGVVPTPGVDLQAQVTPNLVTEGSLRSYPAGVRKISNAGIILKVSAAAHGALSVNETLWLTLKLPSRRQPVRIATHVRHRLFDGTDYVYGCEFDWSGTFDPLGIAEDLLDFVLESGED